MPRQSTPSKRVTIADVAREAGVSRSTVSFVLNKTPGQTIPETTRQRVIAAARKLSYQPSATARALRRGRSDIILFLMPNWSTGEAVAQAMDAISVALAEHGLTYLLHPRATSNRHLSDLWRSVTPALVITVDDLDDDDSAALDAAGIAHMTFGLGDDSRTPHSYQEMIGRIQAEHLIQTGHTRLGYATVPDTSLFTFAESRLRGVQQVCAGYGLPSPLALGAQPGTEAERSLRAWRSAEVTAVAAYNDEVALALLQAARASGVTVPEDLAVIGADDIAAAGLSCPPLTTVRIDPSAFVPALVSTIMAHLNRTPPENAPTIPDGELVLRDSTNVTKKRR
ncbi:LacI family transcriptional regulator [Actinocorallia herbida]|uniref:LacI family transcriptional regulator n=1 Tax=Actinocorallia herbida TaxID=58109 RepID=A0A3N1D2W8_9ACTN|nr:LacI family DNA-binding transcriptional regulator [Actinocorallia herbida]ROO87869.1 LacI family transcriptional regulator [Actinocorallia herbida]